RVVDELRREVFDVRNLGLIERLEQGGLNHALDELAARNDDVVTRIAGTELGEQLVVGRKQAHIDVDAACGLEILERGLAGIGVPVVEIELLLFVGPRGGLLADKTDADRGSAETFQN